MEKGLPTPEETSWTYKVGVGLHPSDVFHYPLQTVDVGSNQGETKDEVASDTEGCWDRVGKKVGRKEEESLERVHHSRPETYVAVVVETVMNTGKEMGHFDWQMEWLVRQREVAGWDKGRVKTYPEQTQHLVCSSLVEGPSYLVGNHPLNSQSFHVLLSFHLQW